MFLKLVPHIFMCKLWHQNYEKFNVVTQHLVEGSCSWTKMFIVSLDVTCLLCLHHISLIY